MHSTLSKLSKSLRMMTYSNFMSHLITFFAINSRVTIATVILNRQPVSPLVLHILSSLRILLWQSYTHKSNFPLFSNPSSLKMTGRLKQSFQTQYHVFFEEKVTKCTKMCLARPVPSVECSRGYRIHRLSLQTRCCYCCCCFYPARPGLVCGETQTQTRCRPDNADLWMSSSLSLSMSLSTLQYSDIPNHSVEVTFQQVLLIWAPLL